MRAIKSKSQKLRNASGCKKKRADILVAQSRELVGAGEMDFGRIKRSVGSGAIRSRWL